MSNSMKPKIYGLSAEFSDPDDLIHAAEKARAEGYRRMDAYTPFPVHGLSDAIGFEDHKVEWTVFIAGIGGAMTGIALELFAMWYDYPLNVGGKPMIAWPQFIPVAYELTILFGAFGAVFGMLLYNGLPRLNHPIFNAPRFDFASQDRFFLCVERIDPKFDLEHTEAFLRGLGAQRVSIVEN